MQAEEQLAGGHSLLDPQEVLDQSAVQTPILACLQTCELMHHMCVYSTNRLATTHLHVNSVKEHLKWSKCHMCRIRAHGTKCKLHTFSISITHTQMVHLSPVMSLHYLCMTLSCMLQKTVITHHTLQQGKLLVIQHVEHLSHFSHVHVHDKKS